MSIWFTWSLAACFICQVDAAAPPTAVDLEQAVAKAIKQLGDAKFSTREAATKFLWQQGLAVEPALKLAAESSDREVRVRAKRILDDFGYGVVPTLPLADVALLRRYRDGEPAERHQVLVDLARRGNFDTMIMLLNREPQFSSRSGILVNVFKDEAAVFKLMEKGQLESIVERIAANETDADRQALRMQLYRTPAALKHLIASQRTETVFSLIKSNNDLAFRNLLLELLVRDRNALGRIAEQGQLVTLLEMIHEFSDKRRAGIRLAVVLTSLSASGAPPEARQAQRVMQFAREKLEPEARVEFFQSLFRNDPYMVSWLKRAGLSELMSEVSSALEGEGRDTVLGVLICCPAVAKHLLDSGQGLHWVTIVQSQNDPIARRALLKQIIHSPNYGRADGRADEPPMRRVHAEKLWEFVRADNDRVWQAKVLVTLLERNIILFQRLADPNESAWLTELAAGEATAERLTLQRWIAREQALAQKNEK